MRPSRPAVALQEPTEARSRVDGEETDCDASKHVGERDAPLAVFKERQAFLCEGREGRVAAEHPHDETGSDPGRRVVAVGERCDHDSDQQATGCVDREGASREDREAASLDEPVSSVASKRSKGTAKRDSEKNRHPYSFVRRSYQRVLAVEGEPHRPRRSYSHVEDCG